MLRALMVFAISNCALIGLAHAKCDTDDPRLAAHINSINKKSEVLRKQVQGAKLVGKIVQRGKCAVTLVRIGAPAPFALAPHESIKDAHEAISCLALEKWQLQQECKCHDGGLNFSRDDEAAERATLQAYKDIQSLRAKLTKIGIRNKAIRSFVDRANEIKFCFDLNTVKIINKIERDMRTLVEADDK